PVGVHFIYDLVWFSIPIFVSSSPHVLKDKIIIIIVALVPTGIVFYSLLNNRGWKKLTDEIYNKSWKPKSDEKKESEEYFITSTPISKRIIILLFILGIIGISISLFIMINSQPEYVVPFQVTKEQVKDIAIKELQNLGFSNISSWTPLIKVSEILDITDIYVWQEEGKEKYIELLGNYLQPPLFNVKFVRFDNEDIIERSEE